MSEKNDTMQQTLIKCIKKFENEDDVIYYKAVRQTFDDHPKNVDKVDVLLKFAVLNELYSTNIWATDKMVNHIHRLATEENLDNLLKEGDLDAIDKIREGHRIGGRDFYSFATKYCHFSNPECYPIYDQYVDKAIMKLRKYNYVEFHKQDELWKSQKFKDIIDKTIKQFGLHDYQQADRALHIYGQKLAGK